MASFANSTIKIACFVPNPTNITRPICEYISNAYPEIYWKNNAPTNAIGDISITAIGNVQLSYKATKNK